MRTGWMVRRALGRSPRTYEELRTLLPDAAIELVGNELVIYTGWALGDDDETLTLDYEED